MSNSNNTVIHINDADFESKVLKSNIPVLVDFWAPWCGPCKAIAPVLEQLATEYGDRVQIAKLDIDENPTTASNFQVRSIPTLLLIKDGQVCEQIVGLASKEKLSEAIDKHLG